MLGGSRATRTIAAASRRPNRLRPTKRDALFTRYPLIRCSRQTDACLQRRPLCSKDTPSAEPPLALPPPPPTHPIALPELSDREMVRRLLLRPQRMRAYWWLGGVALVGATLVAFAPELKVGMSKHTADVATKSLQDETLQANTRELASQIVQTVLNDANVLDQAARFLQRLVSMDMTRDAIRSLVVYTLNDPTTLQHLTRLAKNVLGLLLEDARTREHVVQFLRQTLEDPETREGLLKLLSELMHDERVYRNVASLLAQTFGTEPVKKSVATTLGESVHDVLSRTDIQNHAKQFVGSVVQDQTVQAQSGDAIWWTMMYAITPSWLSWIWQKNVEAEEAAAEAAASVAVVKEAEAVMAETGEAFADAVEMRVESERQADGATVIEPTPEEDVVEEEEVAEQEEDEPRSRLGMLRHLTAWLPSWASKGEPKKSKEEEEVEAIESRNWSGTGSGFL